MDKETSKMLEALHNNHLKEHGEYLEEESKKDLQKKGNTLQIIVLIGIGITLLLMILWLLKLNSKDFIKECVSAGYSKNYCIYELNK